MLAGNIGVDNLEKVAKITKIVEFFINQQVKSIIIACNSASSTALNILKKLYKIPINGVIYPSIQKAVKSTKTKSIGLIGTQATISSNAYVKELYNYKDLIYLFIKRDFYKLENLWADADIKYIEQSA